MIFIVLELQSSPIVGEDKEFVEGLMAFRSTRLWQVGDLDCLLYSTVKLLSADTYQRNPCLPQEKGQVFRGWEESNSFETFSSAIRLVSLFSTVRLQHEMCMTSDSSVQPACFLTAPAKLASALQLLMLFFGQAVLQQQLLVRVVINPSSIMTVGVAFGKG